MSENLVPMVIMTGMFAMIFGIAYVRSRENMAMIEKGLNPKTKAIPRPFVSLKHGLLLMGAGMGLLCAYIIDHTIIDHSKDTVQNITIGGHRSGGHHRAIQLADTTHMAKDTTIKAGISVVIDDNDSDDRDGEEHSITEVRGRHSEGAPIYFALIAIGGGLGLFLSYRIEKKEWMDKKMVA